MPRRVFTAMTLATLLAGLATPTILAATFGPCTTLTGYAPTWNVSRLNRQYISALGQLVVRDLNGCTNPTGQEESFSAVFPANIQGQTDPVTHKYFLIQIGIASREGGAPQYWATCPNPGEFSSGCVSQMTLGFTPVVGHLNKFEIFPTTVGGQAWWELKVTDVTVGPNQYGYRLITKVQSYGPQVWYGIETHNQKDQFGGSSSTLKAQLQYLGYKWIGGPQAWTYLTGVSSTGWASDFPPGSRPTCWVPSVTTITADQYTSLNGYTQGSTC